MALFTKRPAEYPVGSPLWFLRRLDARLAARTSELTRYDAYYRGRHPLTFASTRFKEAFGGLFREDFADNWCALVADAVEERLDVEGFRLGDELEGDTVAWDIWQRNQLDADSQLGHLEALIFGEVSALVWNAGGRAEITLEHPLQTIVEHEAGSRRRRAAGLKEWQDDDGHICATLYLPGFVWKYRTTRKVDSEDALLKPREWEARETGTEPWPLPNPLGVVPLVTQYNRPRLLAGGESEIKGVIPLQRAVNKLVADMLVASEFGAFKQKWATGLDVPLDPKSNLPIEPYQAAINRLWTNPQEGGKFGEFGSTELSNFVAGIETLVQHIASQTRTPPHYFYLSGQFPSGEAIKSAEAGLVAKALRKMRYFGEGWEEIMRLALLVQGETKKAGIVNSEVIWRDPEYHSESERMDALTKLHSLGVADIILWEKAGLSPLEIKRNLKIWADRGIGDKELGRIALSKAAQAATGGTPPPAE